MLRNKPPELPACSPKATVPVLVPGDGEVIDESLDIMYWALSKNDPEGWLVIDRQLAAELIDENDSKFKDFIDRFKYPDRYPDGNGESYRVGGEIFLAKLEGILEKGPYLSGDRLGLIDVALLPFVRQFAYVDIDGFRANRFRAVNAWLQEFLDSTRFESVMEKYPAWRSDSPDQAPVF